MKNTQFLKLEDAVKVAASHFGADKEIAEREFEQKCYISDDQYGLQDKTWTGELPKKREDPGETLCDEVDVIFKRGVGFHGIEFRFSDGTIKRVNIAKFDARLTKRGTAASIMKKGVKHD